MEVQALCVGQAQAGEAPLGVDQVSGIVHDIGAPRLRVMAPRGAHQPVSRGSPRRSRHPDSTATRTRPIRSRYRDCSRRRSRRCVAHGRCEPVGPRRRQPEFSGHALSTTVMSTQGKRTSGSMHTRKRVAGVVRHDHHVDRGRFSGQRQRPSAAGHARITAAANRLRSQRHDMHGDRVLLAYHWPSPDTALSAQETDSVARSLHRRRPSADPGRSHRRAPCATP